MRGALYGAVVSKALKALEALAARSVLKIQEAMRAWNMPIVRKVLRVQRARDELRSRKALCHLVTLVVRRDMRARCVHWI